MASDANDFETEHRIYHEDAVLEYPQSGERTRGRSNIQNRRASQPSKKRFTVRRIIGGGDLWITELIISYDGKPPYTVSIMEFSCAGNTVLCGSIRGSRITRSMGRTVGHIISGRENSRTTPPYAAWEGQEMDWKRLVQFALLGDSDLEQYAIPLVRVSIGLFFAISGANKLFVAGGAKEVYETLVKGAYFAYAALVLTLNCGLRDKELRELQWGRIHLQEAYLVVGESKTDAGSGRTIPLNVLAHKVLKTYSEWYVEKFKDLKAEWFVFPAGKPQPTDPTKPCSSFKTVWRKVREDAGIKGRWHDNRHTFITGLAESGEASDQPIMDIAGHVSKRMLKHYSHIRMEAKRRAVAALISDNTKAANQPEDADANSHSDASLKTVGKEMGKVAKAG